MEWNDVPVGATSEVTRQAIVDRVTELVKSLARKGKLNMISTRGRRFVWIASLAWVPATLCAQVAAPPPGLAASYVGSTACKTCHPAMYERWSKTRMANVVTDPKVHPEVILPDLTKPDPLLTFKIEDIALVYGSKWKQRYFQNVGDDYFPLGAQ